MAHEIDANADDFWPTRIRTDDASKKTRRHRPKTISRAVIAALTITSGWAGSRPSAAANRRAPKTCQFLPETVKT
jgi:hypothetical protein